MKQFLKKIKESIKIAKKIKVLKSVWNKEIVDLDKIDNIWNIIKEANNGDKSLTVGEIATYLFNLSTDGKGE